MKTMISAVLFGVVFGCAQSALPDRVGVCTFMTYVRKFQGCHVPFIHAMQKNPKSDCSKELGIYSECAVKEMLTCYPNSSAPLLKMMLSQSLTKAHMCDNAGLRMQTPDVINGTFPCKITKAQYDQKVNECTEKILNMWRTNRADIPGLCRVFRTTKTCLEKILTDAECIGANELLTKQRIMFGNNNPFCPNGVDELISGGGGSQETTTRAPSPTQSQSTIHKPAVMAIVVTLGSVAVLKLIY